LKQQEGAQFMTERGAFICIEGIDASGKTTQAHRLVRSLRQRGLNSVYTTEPSTGEIGKLIRGYVLDRTKRVPVTVEALLFAADRVDHVEKQIKPALQKGKIVVCDRYIYSTLAYQGAADLDLNWIEQINRFALVPDLALFLDVSPEVVIERMRSKSKRSVMETLQNQRCVREVYLRIVKEGHLVRIDGNKPVNTVAAEILRVVAKFLESVHMFQG
jgi:dTMP kinase